MSVQHAISIHSACTRHKENLRAHSAVVRHQNSASPESQAQETGAVKAYAGMLHWPGNVGRMYRLIMCIECKTLYGISSSPCTHGSHMPAAEYSLSSKHEKTLPTNGKSQGVTIRFDSLMRTEPDRAPCSRLAHIFASFTRSSAQRRA